MFKMTTVVIFKPEEADKIMDAITQFGDYMCDEVGVSPHQVIMYMAEATDEDLNRVKLSEEGNYSNQPVN